MNMLFAPAELNPIDWWLIVSERFWREYPQNGEISEMKLSPEILKRFQETFPYNDFMVRYR